MPDEGTKESVLTLALRQRWPQGQNTNSEHDSDAVSLRHKQTLPIGWSNNCTSAQHMNHANNASILYKPYKMEALPKLTHTQQCQAHTFQVCWTQLG